MKVYGAASLFFFVLQEYGHSSKRKCSLVADKRLRSGLKALGYVLAGPSGRALNACAYSLIQLENLE